MKPPLHVPVLFGHWLVEGDRLECRLPRRTVTVDAPHRLLSQVMRLCDGTREWPQVIETLSKSWTSETVTAFMLGLTQQHVLVESGELWAHWSDVAQLPQLWPTAASDDEIAQLPLHAEGRLLPGRGIADDSVCDGRNPIAAALRSRESSRTFDDRSLSVQTLCSILWAAHGVVRPADSETLRWHRAVGSGGNMHSARWFVAVLRQLPSTSKEQAAVSPGVYEARFHTEGGTSLELVHEDIQAAWGCLRDPRVLRFASALVLPIYDVAVPARKYGNRATLFATIEAGQSLQNAQLMAASLGGASMLRGDTVATESIKLARLAEGDARHWLAMPAMVVGAGPTQRQREDRAAEDFFKVSPNFKPIATAVNAPRHYAFSAWEVGGTARRQAGSGRASDPRRALSIAEAEAWERVGWATLGSVVEGTARDFSNGINPQRLVAYSKQQYRRSGFPFQPFDEGATYLWSNATLVDTGSTHLVPADCVHAWDALPPRFAENACTSSSTSGVAAGRDLDDALMRATLELIERDAFCCSWLAGRALPRVAPDSLPAGLRSRIDQLSAQGVQCTLLDLSTPWCVVLAVFSQSHAMPFTAVTAAAGFDAEQVATKAIDEAEGRFAYVQHIPPEYRPTSDPMRVIEQYYCTARTYRRSDHFGAWEVSRTLAEVGPDAARSWRETQSRLRADGFELFCIDITPEHAAINQGRQPLRVIRAMVPGLVPIWFERGLQPQGMQRFAEAAGVRGGRPAGHFLHPFT